MALPRPVDVLKSAQILFERRDMLHASGVDLGHDKSEWSILFVGTDLADAYFHFRAAEPEWKHLLTKDLDPDHVLLW
eukprot:2841830-Amphidinium_carterae.1